MSNELEQQVPDAAGVEAEAPQQDSTQPQQASTPQPQQAQPAQPIQLDLSKSVPVAKPEAAQPIKLDLSKSVPVNTPSPGTNAGAAKGTRFEAYAKLGNYFYAKPMEGEATLRPALKSLHGFLSFPNALYHAFQDPATPQEKAEIEQKMNQMRAGQNRTSAPGNILPAGPAYSTLPAVPGEYAGIATNTADKKPPAPTRTQLALHRLIDAPADQLDAKANKELETARELWDQREDWTTSIPTGMGVSIPLGHAIAISGSLSGATDKLLSKIPMLGPLVNGIAEKFESGDIEGGMTDLALLKAAEAAHAKLTGEPTGTPSKIWSEKGNQFGEHVREAFTKTEEISKKANEAKEDFQKAAPPSKAAPYDDNDYEIVRRTAEEGHKADKLKGGEGISGIETARDIVEDGRQSIEDKRSGAVKEHADRPITTNVYQDVAKALEQADNTTPGFRDEGMKVLEKHDFKDATVSEADAIRKKLVADNRAIQEKNTWDVSTARQTDPTFAAREAAIDSLRKGIYGALDEAGVPGVYDLARDEAAHIRVRDAIERQLFNAEKTVRGTSGATPLRKITAQVAKAGATTAGTGIGAAVGGVPGAIIGGAAGGVAGEGIARAILPPDMTRDALMARSFENPDLATPSGPTVPESQATPAGSATPGPELPPPPAPIPPAMPPPDHALHAALATRVGSTVERTDFPTLMNKFQRYLERTPVEKLTDGDRELLQQLNESQANRRLQVEDAMKVAVEKNKVAREKWQKEVQKIQEKHAAEQEALTKSNIAAVENDERPTDENPHLASLGRSDESGLVSHSPAMKAHSPAEPIKAAEGITSEMAHRHEWAHMALNAIDSEKPSGNAILAASHPEAEGAATSLFDMSHLFGEGGMLDPDTLRAEETRLLTQKLAGPASHEVFDGMTKDEAMSHAGTKSDVRQARSLVRDIHPEFSPSQVEQVVDAAYERARNFLTQPHIADRIKANAAVRETGLNEDYHASRGRVTQFQDDIRKAHEENGNEPQSSGGGAGEGGEKTEKPAAEEGKKNAGRSKAGSSGEPRESAGQSETARGVSESQVDKAAKGLRERTTGSPETDDAIKAGGGVPAGVLGNVKDAAHVKMFHDPETGTTLGFAANEPVTAEATKAKLTESRRQYAAAELPKEDFAGVHYSNVPAENGVLKGATRGAAKAGSEQARVALGAEPGVYSYREGTQPESQIASRANKYSIEGKKAIADISGPQKDLFQNAYQEAKDAALKAGDNDTVAGHKGLNAAETAVKNAGYDGYESKADYPGNTFLFGDQKVAEPNNWVKKAEATKGEGFSYHPGTGEAPTDGYMVETHLDRGQQYDHPPTAEDIRAFTEKNKDILSKNPDLYVGGYKNTLGISERLTDQAAAEDLGKKTNQISIYDVKNGKEIPTGGTGEVLQPQDLEKSNVAKKTPKGSSVPLMENPLPVKGTMEGGEVGTLDVAKALNKFSRDKNPVLEPGSEPKEMVDRAKKIAEDEAKYQLAQSKTGTEWYTKEMKDHDKVLQDLRPELAGGEMTDSVPDHPVKLTLFKAAEAILSSGQKPYANVKSALRAWDAYNETGEFPRSNPAAGKEGMSWGPRNVNAYGNAFDNLNRLIAEKGEKGAADWLLDEHPVSELKDYKKEVGGKKGDMEAGAKILGEKRGPFMQNLHGIESKFTADMWVSRTWNRWMGTLDLDPRIEAKGKMTSESDVPRNNAERGLMKESFEKTASKLGLTTSSLQAVLWYYEQALYRAHGLPVESWSFSDAAKRVAGEHNAVPESQQTGFNFGANEGEKSPTPQVPTKNPNAVHAFNFLDAIKKK